MYLKTRLAEVPDAKSGIPGGGDDYREVGVPAAAHVSELAIVAGK